MTIASKAATALPALARASGRASGRAAGSVAQPGKQLLLSAGPVRLALPSGLPATAKAGVGDFPAAKQLMKGIKNFTASNPVANRVTSAMTFDNMRQGALTAVKTGLATAAATAALQSPFTVLDAALSAPNAQSKEAQAHLKAIANDCFTKLEDFCNEAREQLDFDSDEYSDLDFMDDKPGKLVIDSLLSSVSEQATKAKEALNSPDTTVKEVVDNFKPLHLAKTMAGEKGSLKGTASTTMASAGKDAATFLDKASSDDGSFEAAIKDTAVATSFSSLFSKMLTGKANPAAIAVDNMATSAADKLAGTLDTKESKNALLQNLLNSTGFDSGLDSRGKQGFGNKIIFKP